MVALTTNQSTALVTMTACFWLAIATEDLTTGQTIALPYCEVCLLGYICMSFENAQHQLLSSLVFSFLHILTLSALHHPRNPGLLWRLRYEASQGQDSARIRYRASTGSTGSTGKSRDPLSAIFIVFIHLTLDLHNYYAATF